MSSGFWLLLLVLVSPLLILLLLDSLLRAWLMLVRWRGPATLGGVTTTPTADKLAVVIPAHDEESVIGPTVARLQAQIPARDVFVIADNCTDDTAAVARQAGVKVWERHQSDERGKGSALRWFLNTAAEELRAYDAIVIFDADTVVYESFWPHARAALAHGADVVQGFVRPLSSGSPVADLAAYSELLSQYIDEAARAQLGWPTPLRGFGMVFRRQVLAEVLSHVRTKVEDIEMSLLLAGRGIPVVFASGGVVGNPQLSARGVAAQRARWLQGQREVLQHHGRLVTHLLLGGRPGDISLILATLFKPKTLVMFLKFLWLIVVLVLPLGLALRWSMAALAGLALSADWVYYVLGLRLVENPGHYMRVLAQAPLYLVMWLWSLVLSLISADPWLSARRD